MSNMMYSICSFLVIFSVISNLNSSDVKRTTCTELTSAQIQAALDAHNFHRRQVGDAADMRKLVWSNQMATIAQSYANLCRGPGPSPCDPSGVTGQNLFLLSDRPTVSPGNISEMVEVWTSLKEYYNNNTGICSGSEYCKYYKQLVWASTFQVGCGIKRCNLPTDPSIINWIFVCHYNPAGNIGDYLPYRHGTHVQNVASR